MKIARYQLAALSGALLLFAPTTAAQSASGAAVTVSVGSAIYDLSGVGNAGIAGARLAFPLGRFFVVEPAVMYFRYTPQFSRHISYLFPEVSLQVQAPLGALRPYAGGGGGIYATIEGPHRSEFTIHATAGLRLDIASNWGLRAEGRLRGLGPIGGHTADLSFGVSRALR